MCKLAWWIEKKVNSVPVSEQQMLHTCWTDTQHLSSAIQAQTTQIISLTACAQDFKLVGVTYSPQLGTHTSFDRIKPMFCQAHV